MMSSTDQLMRQMKDELRTNSKSRPGNAKSIEIRVNKYEEEAKRKIVEMALSDISYADLLVFLENEIATSKKMADFKYAVLCFKNDGVYQLFRAIEELVGVAVAKQEENPSGKENLKMIDIQLADGTRKKVPYGDIALNGLGKDAQISIQYSDSTNQLIVKGQCQVKFSSLIDDIVDRTKELISIDSIYKNQALEIVTLSIPKIMDLSGIEKELMILSERTKFELQPLYSRILHPEKCIANKISLKYGVLMEGGYGTGKTLLAFKLAKEAIQNNWSFVYLKDPKLLANTLRLVQTIDKTGYGTVVFVED